MELIDADALATAMSPRALIDAMREGHRAGTMGLVERSLLEDHARDVSALTWSGWAPELGVAVKTSTIFNGNARRGDVPNIQSVVILFDGTSGTPLAAIHGESFTRMKTAATSALAADVLARHDVHTMAILGSGAQAETQVRFHVAARPSIRQVNVWNRSPEGAERLSRTLNRDGLSATPLRSAEEAVRGAGLVSCVTAATAPVLLGAWLAPGTHVDLVGGYTPVMRESDDEVVSRGRLFADSLRFGVSTCGDYATPLAAGVIGADRIEGDLFSLCSGRVAGRRGPGEITVCKNGGGGHLDLMAARAFYAHAKSLEPDPSAPAWT